MTTRPAPALARWTCDRGHEFWTRTAAPTACPHIRGGKPCPGVPALAPERRSPGLPPTRTGTSRSGLFRTNVEPVPPTTEGAP